MQDSRSRKSEALNRYVSSPAPLFIVGCGRSGTTLLRMMLQTHPALAIPQESHFIYKIARRRALGRWPAKLDESGWDHLVKYLDQSPYLDSWEFDRSAVKGRLDDLSEHTYEAAFSALFREYLQQAGGSMWGDKTPQHVQYMILLCRLFPRSRFIHVVRDGRDVALSLMTRKWGPRRMELAGFYWSWLVLSGIVAGEALGPHRYREIRFEDLVTDPETVLQNICTWMDLPFRSEMLDYHETEAAQSYAQGGQVAKRLAKPPDPSRLYQWRNKMTPRDHRLIVRQAGGLLASLGYTVEDLPQRQERVRAQIDALRETDVLANLTKRTSPVPGPDLIRVPRLLSIRARQGFELFRGDLTGFAADSVLWQRTVASMLR